MPGSVLPDLLRTVPSISPPSFSAASMPLVVRPAAARTGVGFVGGKNEVKPRYHCGSQLVLRSQYGAPKKRTV